MYTVCVCCRDKRKKMYKKGEEKIVCMKFKKT